MKYFDHVYSRYGVSVEEKDMVVDIGATRGIHQIRFGP